MLCLATAAKAKIERIIMKNMVLMVGMNRFMLQLINRIDINIHN